MTGVEVRLGSSDEAMLALGGAWVGADGSGRGRDARLTVGPELVVTGARSRWDLKTGAAVFEGSVRAVRGALVLTAERAELAVNQGQVTRAAASGHVHVVRESREAWAESADFDVRAGKVTLTGGPRVSEGATRISGDRILLFVDDERIECEKCKWEVVSP